MVIWVIKTFFVLVFCVSLPPLLNTSVSFRSILFLSFIVPIFSPPFPLVSLIILSHSIVFLYFFALITEEAFLIPPCYFLELCIQMGISFLFSFTFHFLSFLSYLQALLRQPFCLFSFLFLGIFLIPVSCTVSRTSIHSSSGSLSIISSPFNLFLTSTV